MKKKALALFLSVAMCLLLFPAQALADGENFTEAAAAMESAAEPKTPSEGEKYPEEILDVHSASVASGTCGQNLTWSLDDDYNLTISGSGNMENYSDPTLIPWFNFSDSINSIVIEPGATSIGDYAFINCTLVTSITIPDSVTSIGNTAFGGCNSLSGIIIPECVTSIGMFAFSGCSNLISAGPIGSGCNYEFGWSETIPDRAFYACDGLSSITLPAGITSIGEFAFYSCNSLSGIIIPESVTSIGDRAFIFCRSLNSITIPDGVASIGDNTFSNCGSLNTITIPDSVTSIGSGAFSDCDNLATVYYKGTPEQWAAISIGEDNEALTGAEIITGFDEITWNYADGVLTVSGNGTISDYNYEESRPAPWEEYNTEITTIIIDEDVTEIGDQAFANMPNLISVQLPEGLCSIGSGAFENAVNLSSIQLPEGLQELGAFSFYGCSTLGEITIPNGIRQLQYSTFMGCTGLSAVYLPRWLENIGTGCFSGCENLSSVYYPGTQLGVELIYFSVGNDALLSAEWSFGNQSTEGVYVFSTFDEFRELMNSELYVNTSLTGYARLVYTGVGTFTFEENIDCRYQEVHFNNHEIQAPAGEVVTILYGWFYDVGGVIGGSLNLDQSYIYAAEEVFDASWLEHLTLDTSSITLTSEVNISEDLALVLSNDIPNSHIRHQVDIKGDVQLTENVSLQSSSEFFITGSLTASQQFQLGSGDVIVEGSLIIAEGASLECSSLVIENNGVLNVNEGSALTCDYYGSAGGITVVNGVATINHNSWIMYGGLTQVNGRLRLTREAYYGHSGNALEEMISFGEKGTLEVLCIIYDESDLNQTAVDFTTTNPEHITLNLIVQFQLSLSDNFTVPAGSILQIQGNGIADGGLMIPEGVTLTVNPDAELSVYGTDVYLNGSLVNLGSITMTAYEDNDGNRFGSRLVFGENAVYNGDVSWVFANEDSVFSLPESVTIVGSEAFAGVAAAVIEIPATCVEIAIDTFDGCADLKYIVNHSAVMITVPDGVGVLTDRETE